MIALGLLAVGCNQTPALPTAETQIGSQAATICGNQAVPSGWVVMRAYFSSSCGSGFGNNTFVIENTAGKTSLTPVCAAYSYPPTGWVATSISSYSGCSNTSSVSNTSYTIRNTAGLSTLSGMCATVTPPPSGWVVTSVNSSSSACSAPGRSPIAYNITNTATTTSIPTMCNNYSAVPTGWVVTSRFTSGACGTGLNTAVSIRKL